jgi:hypothetical protein
MALLPSRVYFMLLHYQLLPPRVRTTNICVLILLYMCPHTTVHVSSGGAGWLCCLPESTLYYYTTTLLPPRYYCIQYTTTTTLLRCCLLELLLHMYLRTAIYVSSYYYICVLILLYMCPQVVLDGSAASQSLLSTLDELVSVFLERESVCVSLCCVSEFSQYVWHRGLVSAVAHTACRLEV